MTGELQQQLIDSVEQFYLVNYFITATCALVLYDSILSLGDEKELIWSGRTGSVIIFALNRLASGCYCVVKLFQVMTIGNTSASCKPVMYLGFTLEWCILIIWAVLSGLRVYAVRRGSLWLAAFTFLLGLAPICEDLVANAALLSFRSTQVGSVTICRMYEASGGQWIVTRKWLILLVFWRICPIASDMTVLFATWHMVYRKSRINRIRTRQNTRISLAKLLVRDGAICFLLVVTLQTIGLAINVILMTDDFQSVVIPLMSVATSRFILSIRKAYYAQAPELASQYGTRPLSFVRTDLPVRSAAQTLRSDQVDTMSDDPEATMVQHVGWREEFATVRSVNESDDWIPGVMHGHAELEMQIHGHPSQKKAASEEDGHEEDPAS